MKKILALSAAIITIFCFSSCSNEESKGSVDFGDYSLENTESTSLKYNKDELLNSDDSWQKSYALSYNYYDKKSGQSTITEARCGKYYQSLDKSTNITTYLSQESGYILEYMLNNDSLTGTTTIITNNEMDDLYSGFSQLSVCDPYFPVYKNVLKVGTDFVAERSATRYRQTEQEDGENSKIAYVWIDDQYGFCSRCELYDAATEELLMSWELLEFTRNVKEEDLKIDVSEYDIKS